MSLSTSFVSRDSLSSLALFASTVLAYRWYLRVCKNVYRGLERDACPTATFAEIFDDAGTAKSREDSESDDIVIVDVRTPKEYAEAHVWGAVNIPLMSNEQRHEIGLTYHEQSKQAAIALGWELFTAQAVTEFVQQFEQYRNNKRSIFVYCWRGGMRSRIVVNVLRRHGFTNVSQCTGGYKVYLKNIIWKGLDAMARAYSPVFIVLYGHTGTRKTEILRHLATRTGHKLPVLDLEGLAGHRSSVYGAVDLQPASQKMFSIGIYHTLCKLRDEPFLFMEGEAQKVGDVHVPAFLVERIAGAAASHKVLVQATLETRIAALKEDYLQHGQASVDQIAAATETVRKYVGNANADQLQAWLAAGEYDAFCEWLLVNHYDTGYRFHKKGHVYAVTVQSDDLEACCAQLTSYYQSLLDKRADGSTAGNNQTAAPKK